MNKVKPYLSPILLATIWIAVSEFFRNQVLVVGAWIGLYQSLGLRFPASPINGAVWGLWSLLFAIAITILANRFTLRQTGFIAWFMGFVLMWITMANLDFLPYDILWLAIPLSLLESYGAAWIVHRYLPRSS